MSIILKLKPINKMSNLTKEAIEAIEAQIDESVSNRNDMILGCKEALTNPTIYQAAGLMSVDEALRFAHWYNNLTAWDDFQGKTMNDLLTIFRNQKEVK